MRVLTLPSVFSFIFLAQGGDQAISLTCLGIGIWLGDTTTISLAYFLICLIQESSCVDPSKNQIHIQ